MIYRPSILPPNTDLSALEGYALDGNSIILSEWGSRLYGTHNDKSDYDYRGFYLPSKRSWLGLRTKDQLELKVPDMVVYDVRKFISLIMKGNPTILEISCSICQRASSIDSYSNRRDMLVDSFAYNFKKMLSGRATQAAYIGYSTAQLKEIERATAGALGDKRKQMIEAYGYDAKAASHAIRVLQDSKTILNGELIKFPYANAEDLKKIKSGQVSKGDIVKEISEKIEELRKLSPTIQPEADLEAAEEFLQACFNEVKFGSV